MLAAAVTSKLSDECCAVAMLILGTVSFVQHLSRSALVRIAAFYEKSAQHSTIDAKSQQVRSRFARFRTHSQTV